MKRLREDCIPLAVARVAPGIRRFYRQIQFVLDLIVLSAAFLLSYLLRFEFDIRAQFEQVATQLAFVVLVQFAAMMFGGVYHRVWRYTSLRDMPAYLRSFALATAVILAVRLAPLDSLNALRVPISIILIDAFLGFAAVVGMRTLRRSIDERRKEANHHRAPGGTDHAPVILIGAGRAGVMAMREVAGRGDAGIVPLAFVDDDPLKQNTIIGGVRVRGTVEDLPRLVQELEVDHVVLTIADLTPAQKQRIVEICERIPIKVREIPGYYEVLQGDISFSRMRDVDPEELLGRQPVRLDEEKLRAFLGGRRVIVTGAGGSIGSELCRQIARFGPECLGMVERSEFALFEICRELHEARPGVDIRPILADVTDEARMQEVLAGVRPDVIVHAAAHKHVPMMELHPVEALKNNICGTHTLARLAGEIGVPHFILVSTDKAVRPTSVMGASKRVAELVIQEMSRRYETTYAAVRFGNVLGSAGSVIPIFRDQIARGGPVTVTDGEMQRYFMSIPEAAQLVLRAGTIAEGGEIFVLDMGEPVKILDLAERMIRLSGFEPYEEIPIVITGRRRGEKLYEELGFDGEALDLTRHPKIFVGRLEPYPTERLEAGLARMRELAECGDGEAVRAFLAEFLPESSLDLAQAPEAPARSAP